MRAPAAFQSYPGSMFPHEETDMTEQNTANANGPDSSRASKVISQ